jgi:hypothetical protein
MKVLSRIFVTAFLFGITSAYSQSRNTEIPLDSSGPKLDQELAAPPCASRCIEGLIQLVTPLEKKSIDTFESHGGPAMNAILRFGIENGIPLRLIASGDHLCSKIELTVRNQTAGEVVDAIVKQVDGYQWSVKDGVLAIEPRTLSSSTAKLLTTQIPQFHVGPATTQDFEQLLWMFTKAVINPQKGYLLGHIDSADAAKIPRVEMSDATVEQILDNVVKQGGAGAWILTPPISDDYVKSADRPFVKIVRYSDQHAEHYPTCNSILNF